MESHLLETPLIRIITKTLQLQATIQQQRQQNINEKLKKNACDKNHLVRSLREDKNMNERTKIKSFSIFLYMHVGIFRKKSHNNNKKNNIM